MSKQVEIKIKYFAEGLEPIQTAAGSDWIDLRAAEEVHMEAGECDIDRIVCVVVTKVLLQDLHRNRCLPHFLPLRTISSLPQ